MTSENRFAVPDCFEAILPKRWFPFGTTWLQKGSISIPNYLGTIIFTIICHEFPELKEYTELVDVIWEDLRVAGFHNTCGIRTTMTGECALALRTTPLDQEFLAFISGE